MPLRDDFTNADAQRDEHVQHHNDLAAAVNLLGWRLADSVELAVDTLAIDLTVPSGYTHLKVIWSARVDSTLFGMDAFIARFNSDTGASSNLYNTLQLYGRGTDDNSWWSSTSTPVYAAATSGGSPTTQINPAERVLTDVNNALNQGNNMRWGYAPSALVADSLAMGWGEATIPWYGLTDRYKGIFTDGGAWMGGTDYVAFNNFCQWLKNPPEAITSIHLEGSNSAHVVAGSRADLYVI